MRRLHRDGESEYFINRARVRRLDVLELLSDTGLGREMHSVIGQGRVEEILLAKPHERRRFVEEAAGLGKYQRRRIARRVEAARVEGELERARDLEREVRARLRPLAMQATAAERAAKLGAEIAAGRISLLSSELLGERAPLDRAAQRGWRTQTSSATRIDAEVAAIGERRAAAERELAGLAGAQERAARAFYAFETARERLAARARPRRRAPWPRWSAPRRGAGVDAEAAAARRTRPAAAEAEAADVAAQQHVAEAAALEAADRGGLDEAAAAAEAALAAALDARRAHAEAAGPGGEPAPGASRRASPGWPSCGRRLERAGPARPRIARRAGHGRRPRWRRSTARHRRGRRPAGGGDRRAAAARGSGQRPAREADRGAREACGRARRSGWRRWRARLESLDAAIERGRRAAAGGARAARPRGPAAGHRDRGGAGLRARGRRGARLARRRRGDRAARGCARPAARRPSGELAVVTGRAGRGERPCRRPERPTAGRGGDAPRPVAGLRLIDGVWLVDDLAAVEQGVAVTADGAGIDADRGELWRVADAGEAAWLAARAERDRLAGEHGCAGAGGGRCRRRARPSAAGGARRRGAGRAGGAVARCTRPAPRTAEVGRESAAQRPRPARPPGRRAGAQRCRPRPGRARSGDRDGPAGRAAGALGRVRGVARPSAARRRRPPTSAMPRSRPRRRRLADEAARLGGADGGGSTSGSSASRGRGRAGPRGRRAGAGVGRSAPTAAAVGRGRRGAGDPGDDGRAGGLRWPPPSGWPSRRAAGIEEIERRAARAGGRAAEPARRPRRRPRAGRARSRRPLTEVEVSLARGARAQRGADPPPRGAGRRASSVEWEEPAEPLLPDEAAALAARLERLERRRESLGAVNPLAAEEYEQEKVRADDLSAQCDDLETSLAELRGLIRDLTADHRPAVRRHLRVGGAQLRRGDRHAVPGRQRPAAPDGAGRRLRREALRGRRRRGRGGRRGGRTPSRASSSRCGRPASASSRSRCSRAARSR